MISSGRNITSGGSRISWEGAPTPRALHENEKKNGVKGRRRICLSDRKLSTLLTEIGKSLTIIYQTILEKHRKLVTTLDNC